MRALLLILGGLATAGGASFAYWYWFSESRIDLPVWAADGSTFYILRKGRDYCVYVVHADKSEQLLGGFDTREEASARVAKYVTDAQGPSVGGGRPSTGGITMKSNPVQKDPQSGEQTEQADQFYNFNTMMANG